jgi:hypothetical protein
LARKIEAGLTNGQTGTVAALKRDSVPPGNVGNSRCDDGGAIFMKAEKTMSTAMAEGGQQMRPALATKFGGRTGTESRDA